jgi:hypothetical protein
MFDVVVGQHERWMGKRYNLRMVGILVKKHEVFHGHFGWAHDAEAGRDKCVAFTKEPWVQFESVGELNDFGGVVAVSSVWECKPRFNTSFDDVPEAFLENGQRTIKVCRW